MAALLAVATTGGAQAPVQKANPKALIPSYVTTPVKVHKQIKGSQAATRDFGKATPRRAQSQQTELINEDFSKFTNGSEDAPDTVDWVANSWQGTSNDIDASLTHQSGWIGNFIAQANGTAGLRAPGAAYMTSAYIATPAQDYSGSVTVTFRAKRWPGYRGNVNITSYVADDNGNGYGASPGSTGTFRIFGQDDGWQYYTWTFDWYDSNPADRIWLMTYDWVIIDDINVRVSADNFVAEPTVKDVTNVTDSSFTINWETVRAANIYLVGLKKKVWSTDADSASYFYDFEDGQVPEAISTTGSVEDGVGLDGSKAVALANNDTITFPVNNATYKTFNMYAGIVGPEDGSYQDLQTSRIMFYTSADGVTWQSRGYYQAAYFFVSPGQMNVLNDGWSDLSNRYAGIRFVAADFPDGYKLVFDSVAITTNRPYDFEIINEPDNFYSYGENYNYRTGEGFVDWHVTSTISNPVNSYTVERLDQIGLTYDPSAEYYYSVIARRYATNSTYTWYHAFCLPAPVATGATDQDERGSYTANWTGPVKATRYTVTNYGVYSAAEDEANHALIDEDFSLFNSDVTSSTDPSNPESLGNDYSRMSFDGYTKLPGWTGLSNTVAQGYLGCAAGYYYVPYITTPAFQADNDSVVTLDIKAVGTAGDYLTLEFQDGVTYLAAFDESGNINIEGQVPESAKEMSIRIGSYNYAAFMLDEFAVKQNLKKGASVFTPLESVTVGADTLSYSFTGLTDDYDYYAYDVVALQDLDGETATSEPSERILLTLDPTGIESVNGVDSPSKGFAKVVARYSIDGRQVEAGTKGLQIWKLSDGTVLKTVVR